MTIRMKTGAERSRHFNVLIMAGGAILFGTESVVVQLCYDTGFNVISLASARLVIASLGALILLKALRQPVLPAPAQRRLTVICGLLSVMVTVLLYTALSLMPAALAILFLYAYPSLTAVISRLFFQGPLLGHMTVLALFISASGLILLYWTSADTLSIPGLFCALGTAFCQAFRLNFTEIVLKDLPPMTYNFNMLLMNGVILSLAALLGIGGGFNFTSVAGTGWLFVLYLALPISVGALFVLYRGVFTLGPVGTSLLMLLEAPATALMALLVFGDKLSPVQILGGALILFAVALPHIVELRRDLLQRKAQIKEVS